MINTNHDLQARGKKNNTGQLQMTNKVCIDAGHLFNKKILIQNTH